MIVLKNVYQVNQVKEEIASRNSRCEAIDRRIAAIRKLLAFLSMQDLGEASIELTELQVEKRNHAEYIRSAKQWVSNFYSCSHTA